MTTNNKIPMWTVNHLCYEIFNFKTGSIPDNSDDLLNEFHTSNYQLAVDKQKEYVKEAKREYKRLNCKIIDERTYNINGVNFIQIVFERDERTFVTIVLLGLLLTSKK